MAAQDWHEFPQWAPQDLSLMFPTLDAAGLDFMAAMFIYDPAKRLTVRPGLRVQGLQTHVSLVLVYHPTNCGP